MGWICPATTATTTTATTSAVAERKRARTGPEWVGRTRRRDQPPATPEPLCCGGGARRKFPWAADAAHAAATPQPSPGAPDEALPRAKQRARAAQARSISPAPRPLWCSPAAPSTATPAAAAASSASSEGQESQLCRPYSQYDPAELGAPERSSEPAHALPHQQPEKRWQTAYA